MSNYTTPRSVCNICAPIFNEKLKPNFNGFELAHIVGLSKLPRSAGHILAHCANLAATTDAYFIHKPHKLIAAETGYSHATVARAFREAVRRGMVTVEAVNGQHNERQANMYRFTQQYLMFVCKVKEQLLASKLKITSSALRVKSVVNKLLVSFDFLSTPPSQNDSGSPSQNDGPIKNKRTPFKKTKRLNSGKTGKLSGLNSKKLFHWIAAAKTAAQNRRHAQKLKDQQQHREIVKREAKRYAYLKRYRDASCPGISDFSGLPTVRTVSEAMEQMKQQGYVSEFERKEWSIPPGFQGG